MIFHSGHCVGNNSFKDLIDFRTFSLVRLFRNLTPPSVGGWPMFALGLDRIRRDGCRCSGQIVHTTVRAYFMHVVFSMADSSYYCPCVYFAHVALFVCGFNIYILPDMILRLFSFGLFNI